ncbi:hypothetical protein WAK64_22275 [Bacillus spongiae]|uniref:Uncharacterized protein n=1 Tax=Bacillus spongiae TaxID=2683610 RepID=A0ABU8HKY2_9BACI
MKYVYSLFWLCFIPFLMSCNQETVDTEENLGCKVKNCKLVYDGVNYYTYDIEEMVNRDKIDSTDNEFEYRLYNNDEYITKGNSITNRFKILKRNNEQFQTIYSHENDSEAIFPLAVVDSQYIFAVMDYSGDEQSFKGLFKLNEENDLEQLETMKNEMSEKIFGIGMSSENNMYTLLFEDGQQNLYETNLSLSKFDLIAEGVSQNLSSFGEDICYMKDQQLLCGQKVMKNLEPVVVLSWVVGDKYILEVDDTGNFEVSELNGGEIIVNGTDFIGFEETLSEVSIYCDGKIEKLELDT